MRPSVRAVALSAAALFFVLGLASAVPPAAATHESTHRYYVYGVVTDTAGSPLSGIVVQVEAPQSSTYSEQHTWSATTDSSGRYSMIVHLHHISTIDDEGTTLYVRVPAANVTRTYTATASGVPTDQSQDPEVVGWGYTRADFSIVPPAPAPPIDFQGLAVPLAVLGGAVAVLFVASLLWRRGEGRRQSARVKQARQSVDSLPGVGRATAQRLSTAGYPLITQVARADAAELAKKLGVDEAQARRLIAKAKKHVKGAG